MIQADHFIDILTRLGNEFRFAANNDYLNGDKKVGAGSFLSGMIEESSLHNPWFVPSFVRFAFAAWADALQEDKVKRWIGNYPTYNSDKKDAPIGGIIMAGNIPLVGLHDLLCVLATGNRALIKLSSADNQLIPAVIRVLSEISPGLKDRIIIADGPMKNFDAIIATGSNNSSRYFEYYFGKYPHIIRKNRNGVAVITGNETENDIRKLADDIFMYFGLGCRNVSKLYLPEGFKIEDILPDFNDYAFLADMHKYRNNYDYQKSILLINRVPHLDNGFLLIKEDPSLISPISVVHTETYHSLKELNQHLGGIAEQVQCIVTVSNEIDPAIPPGSSQYPELWDYADGVDTFAFLKNLQKIN